MTLISIAVTVTSMVVVVMTSGLGHPGTLASVGSFVKLGILLVPTVIMVCPVSQGGTDPVAVFSPVVGPCKSEPDALEMSLGGAEAAAVSSAVPD